MTRKELLAGMAILEAAIGKAYASEHIPTWERLFADIDGPVFVKACERAALETQIPALPTVGQIRRLVSELTVGLAVTPEEAFGQVRAAMAQFGWMGSKAAEEFLGPEIWGVIRGIGGWRSLHEGTADDRGILFAQFRDGWLRASERAAQVARLPESLRPKVAGLLPGMPVPPGPAPKRIGRSVAATLADALSVPVDKKVARRKSPGKPESAPPSIEQVEAMKERKAEQLARMNEAFPGSVKTEQAES